MTLDVKVSDDGLTLCWGSKIYTLKRPWDVTSCLELSSPLFVLNEYESMVKVLKDIKA